MKFVDRRCPQGGPQVGDARRVPKVPAGGRGSAALGKACLEIPLCRKHRLRQGIVLKIEGMTAETLVAHVRDALK